LLSFRGVSFKRKKMKLWTSKLVIITLPLLPLSSYAHVNINNLKQWKNPESKEQWVVKSIKKAAWALALTVALWANPANAKIVNDIKSYEDACLNSVAWEKVTILVWEDFYRAHRQEILKSIPEEYTCEIKWYDQNTKSVVFPVVKKDWKKYFKISFKAGEWDLDASDIVAQEQAEAEKAKTEAEAEWYYWWMLDIFNETILPNVWKNKKEVIYWLKKINKWLIEWNLDKHKKEKIIKWLWIVKLNYSNDKDILNLIYEIAKKLKISNDVKEFRL